MFESINPSCVVSGGGKTAVFLSSLLAFTDQFPEKLDGERDLLLPYHTPTPTDVGYFEVLASNC
jgi:hypothetical protein